MNSSGPETRSEPRACAVSPLSSRPVIVQVCTAPDFLQFTRPHLVELVRRGYGVHAISSPGAALFELEHLGVGVHPVPMSRGIDIAADARAIPRLLAVLRRLRPTVVHAHTPKAGLLGMLCARSLSVAHRFYHMHGLRYESALGWKRRVLFNAERLSAGWATHTLCVSDSVRKVAQRDGVIEDDCSVLHHGSAVGIDPTAYCPGRYAEQAAQLRHQLGIAPSQPVVGFAGRLAADKGLQRLGEAWRAVAESCPSAHLVLAGAEDPTDPVSLLGLRALPHVHFLGRLETLGPFFEMCDVVTLPSRREGLPQVLLEAAAMEVPAVCFEATGTRDAVVDRETGVLVGANDVGALSLWIARLLQDPALRGPLGRRARQWVSERFHQRDVVAAMMQFYSSRLGT